MAAEQKSKPFAFISYSSEDVEDVLQIRGFLADKGLSSWMALKDIPAGADHAEEIPTAIENCDAFILILSKNAQESSWIPKELDTAISAKKLILPFRIDDSQLKKSFDYRLKDTQIMTAYRRYGDACVDLARKLCSAWGIVYPEDAPLADESADIFDLPFLNSLLCQRLTSDPASKELIRKMDCPHNPGLTYYLQQFGWDEDLRKESSVFLIKNPQNQVLMFFTLKCGVLYESLDIEELHQRFDKCEHLLNIMRKKNRTAEEQFELEQVENSCNLHGAQLQVHISRERLSLAEQLRMIRDEQMNTSNPSVSLVSRTYPAVELAQFAVNDAAKDYWREFMKQHNFSRPMGEVLFWRFIVPAICRVQDAAGCTYVYTYAADATTDKSLTKYLQYRLNFQQPDSIGVNKQIYDFGCEFMCQKIDALIQRRQAYFDQFRNELP